jgi:rod shape-determining protein MreC
MKLFKNKFLGILAAIALFAVIFYSVLGMMGKVSVFHNALGVVATPFRWCFTKAGDALSGFGNYFGELDRLREENEALSSRVAELERENAHVEVLEGENQWLRNFLGVKNVLEHCVTVEAEVIGREANSYLTLFTLNRGSLHGIEAGMAVVSDGGVVGRVETVGLNWCRVSTIVENGVSVGALCARSGARGIVDGSLGLRGKGQCAMNYISEFSDIEVGDSIISSGGGVYPYGFLIGTVVEETFDAGTRTVSAIIEPAVNFETLSRVMIVTEVDIEAMEAIADEAEAAREAETQASEEE